MTDALRFKIFLMALPNPLSQKQFIQAVGIAKSTAQDKYFNNEYTFSEADYALIERVTGANFQDFLTDFKPIKTIKDFQYETELLKKEVEKLSVELADKKRIIELLEAGQGQG